MNTPLFGLNFNRSHNFLVQSIPLLEKIIKRKLTNFRSHGGLREIDNRVSIIFDIVRGLLRVHNLDVKYPINMQVNVVLGDSHLGCDFDGLLSQVMNVFDGVDQRDLEVKTRLQLPLEFLKPMKQDSVLLWDNHHATKPGPVVFSDSLRMLVLTLLAVGQRAELSCMKGRNGQSLLVKSYHGIHYFIL